MTPQENKENELFFTAPRTGHRDTSMDTPRAGVSTREKIVKNRIPWWNELINKGKSEHQLTKKGVLAK